jgi:ubiquinone/menaquinone biosynthesis C-methylase UbiE
VADKWKQIWEQKNVVRSNDDLLDALVKANGFDGGFGNYSTLDYFRMVENLVQRLGIKENSKVLEIGCGSGALLYAIAKISSAKIYGYDYSKSLISEARRYVNGQFEVSEAIHCPFQDIPFEFVISHSVFQYFPSKKYALEVVTLMAGLIQQGGKLAIYDLNNSDKEHEYHALRRQAYEDPAAYDDKYKDLNHLFFDKDELILWLNNLGFKDINFPENLSSSYENSTFRFNVCATKS